MKYACSIDIHLPRERVIALFDDPANLKRWQPHLRSFEKLDGTPGTVGARSKLTYKKGNRDMVMTETITVRQLPERFAGTYTMDGVLNTVDNRFEVVNDELTRWNAEVEFKFTNPILTLLGWVVPGMFRKQTAEFMQNFKNFAENQTDEGLERTRMDR
jgi:carbon monoxide dehydrogenase subunit G